MFQVFPLVQRIRVGGHIAVDLKLRWDNESLVVEYRAFSFNTSTLSTISLVLSKRFREVMKQLTHFRLRFKIKLVVRETETIAFATFFVGSNGRALHIAGIHTQQNIMRVRVLLIHIVRIIGADHLYVVLFSIFKQYRCLLVSCSGNIMALQFYIIIFAKQIQPPFKFRFGFILGFAQNSLRYRCANTASGSN